jgi:hypothetical protein
MDPDPGDHGPDPQHCLLQNIPLRNGDLSPNSELLPLLRNEDLPMPSGPVPPQESCAFVCSAQIDVLYRPKHWQNSSLPPPPSLFWDVPFNTFLSHNARLCQTIIFCTKIFMDHTNIIDNKLCFNLRIFFFPTPPLPSH